MAGFQCVGVSVGSFSTTLEIFRTNEANIDVRMRQRNAKISKSPAGPNYEYENITCRVFRNQNLELFVLSYPDRDICDDLEFDFEF